MGTNHASASAPMPVDGSGTSTKSTSIHEFTNCPPSGVVLPGSLIRRALKISTRYSRANVPYGTGMAMPSSASVWPSNVNVPVPAEHKLLLAASLLVSPFEMKMLL